MNVKEAIALVRGNPAAVEALDAEAAAEAKAEAAEAERRAKAEARVAAAIDERVEALIADYVALGQDALRKAAEGIARSQLEAESGMVPPEIVARAGYPTRVRPTRVAAIHDGLAQSAPIPWDRAGRSASAINSDFAREAAAQAPPAKSPFSPEELRERDQRGQQSEARAAAEERRRVAVAARKAAARAAGLLPPEKP